MSEDFINNFNGNRVACVGTNDGISEELFPEGYETAIDMLFKEVFNKGFFEEDLLVFGDFFSIKISAFLPLFCIKKFLFNSFDN